MYDKNYATMDPVPHNVYAPASGGGGGGYSSGVGYAPRRYLDHGLPEGAREPLVFPLSVMAAQKLQWLCQYSETSE